MEYKTEDISPVKKSVSVTVAPAEVDSAIMAAAALAKDSAQLPGFRKGKAPLNLVEKHLQDEIYSRARQDLINVHINEILEKLDVSPVSGLDIKEDGQPLKKGNAYHYTLQFEVLPQFEIPQYEGLSVEQHTRKIEDSDVQNVLEKTLRQEARLVPVEGNAPAKDGQVANIDFEFFENGKPVEDLKVTGFNLEIGSGQALPDFENIVKGIPLGNTGEGQVSFPDDFLNPDLAGKTVTARVTVQAVKKPELAELDDEFAKKMGFENLETMREKIKANLERSYDNLQKGIAQQQLLDQMLKMTDFPLPPSLVEMEQRLILTDLAARLEKEGRSLASLGKTLEELLEEARPRAEEMTRSQVLLLSIAKKENLEITQQEVNLNILSNCLKSGEDYRTVIKNMEQNGLIYEMRDRLLADKAMDRVYEKANVTLVDDAGKAAAEVKDVSVSEDSVPPPLVENEAAPVIDAGTGNSANTANGDVPPALVETPAPSTPAQEV